MYTTPCADPAYTVDPNPQQRGNAGRDAPHQVAVTGVAKPPRSASYLTHHGATRARPIRAARGLHHLKALGPWPRLQQTSRSPDPISTYQPTTSATYSLHANSRTHTLVPDATSKGTATSAQMHPVRFRSGSKPGASYPPSTSASCHAKRMIPQPALFSSLCVLHALRSAMEQVLPC